MNGQDQSPSTVTSPQRCGELVQLGAQDALLSHLVEGADSEGNGVIIIIHAPDYGPDRLGCHDETFTQPSGDPGYRPTGPS